MKSENRWVYIIGVGILAALVVVGLVWRSGIGDSSLSESDAGGSDGAASDSSAESMLSHGDGAANLLSLRDAHDDIGNVPEDPEECRQYCSRLVAQGALAEGTEQETCVRQLCQSSDDTAENVQESGSVEVSTITEPDVPAMPEDCRAQCQLLHRRGELRRGTSLEDCYAALCSSDEGGEEE